MRLKKMEKVSSPLPSVSLSATKGVEKKPRLDGTLVKAFALIELLASKDQPQGVTAIAQYFGWQKSNAHRLLTTLSVLGYVRQDPNTSRYELSLKTWELGMKVVGRSMIKRCAQPFMRALSQKFQENVNLSILVGTDILYLDNLMSSHPLRTAVSVGGRVPAIFTAHGKCLLAYRSDAPSIVREVIRSHPKAASLSYSAVMKDLAQIRKVGYATSLSGWRSNVNSVSAAIQTSDGVSLAAIGISGPSERMPVKRLIEIAPQVISAAAQIAETIGASTISY